MGNRATQLPSTTELQYPTITTTTATTVLPERVHQHHPHPHHHHHEHRSDSHDFYVRPESVEKYLQPTSTTLSEYLQTIKQSTPPKDPLVRNSSDNTAAVELNFSDKKPKSLGNFIFGAKSRNFNLNKHVEFEMQNPNMPPLTWLKSSANKLAKTKAKHKYEFKQNEGDTNQQQTGLPTDTDSDEDQAIKTDPKGLTLNILRSKLSGYFNPATNTLDNCGSSVSSTSEDDTIQVNTHRTVQNPTSSPQCPSICSVDRTKSIVDAHSISSSLSLAETSQNPKTTRTNTDTHKFTTSFDYLNQTRPEGDTQRSISMGYLQKNPFRPGNLGDEIRKELPQLGMKLHPDGRLTYTAYIRPDSNRVPSSKFLQDLNRRVQRTLIGLERQYKCEIKLNQQLIPYRGTFVHSLVISGTNQYDIVRCRNALPDCIEKHLITSFAYTETNTHKR